MHRPGFPSETRPTVNISITKALIADRVGNPDLKSLQHREVWHLELDEPAFPIARITNLFPMGWVERFQTLPIRYKMDLDRPWA